MRTDQTERYEPTRRRLLQGAMAATAIVACPAVLRAQPAPLRLGSLNSLTGAGGPYGPIMRDLAQAAVREVNAQGGVLGRPVELIAEDDQTNPEAGLRAARKLVEVDRVNAIVGVWSSSVSTSIAPTCWQNEVPFFCCAGADSVTQLPHQGYIFRTQPLTRFQIAAAMQFLLAEKPKRIGAMFVQTPWAQPALDTLRQMGSANAIEVEGIIYEPDRTTYRSELDQILRGRPDWLFLGGLTPDTTILLREAFRANFQGRIMAGAYSVNTRLLEALPKEVTQGVVTFDPANAETSPSFDHAKRLINSSTVDRFSAQAFDHAVMAMLAAERGKATSGRAIRDNVRPIAQGDGVVVHTALDGLKELRAGKQVNYDGASGSLEFNDIGDVIKAGYRFDRIEDGKPKLVRMTN